VSLLTNPAAPDYLMLLPMQPNTAYADVPKMSLFWAKLDASDPNGGYEERHGGSFPHVVRLFQHGLIGQGFGLDSLRHDPPRRFRIAGKNIVQGAKLRLFRQNEDGGSPPDPNLPIAHPNQPTLLPIDIPIYPTDEMLVDGSHVWETAVELDALNYYMLMLGGPFAPGVQDAVLDTAPFPGDVFKISEPPQAGEPYNPDPQTWNWVGVRVINPDGTLGDGGWQRVTVD